MVEVRMIDFGTGCEITIPKAGRTLPELINMVKSELDDKFNLQNFRLRLKNFENKKGDLYLEYEAMRVSPGFESNEDKIRARARSIILG